VCSMLRLPRMETMPKRSTHWLTLEREVLGDVVELDVALEYRYNDDIGLNAIYSDIEDKSFANASFENVRVFVNYSF